MSCPDPNCKFRSRKEIQRSDVGFIPDTDASTCFSSQSGADRSSLQDVQDMEPMMSPVRGSGGQQTSGEGYELCDLSSQVYSHTIVWDGLFLTTSVHIVTRIWYPPVSFLVSWVSVFCLIRGGSQC